MTSLGSSTWTEVDGRRPLLAVPLGSCEQHGPHLPLATDTMIADALVDALVTARPDDVVGAPAIAVTASGEHAGFAGTLSIGTEALTLVLVELARSADWARGVVFVNGHGGNADAVRLATAVLAAESRPALAWWPPVPGDLGVPADAHAGFVETSLLLHLAPASVRVERAEAGATRPVTEIAGRLRSVGVRAVSPNGVLGDPSGANAGDGARLFARFVDDLVAHVDGWRA